MLAFLQAALDGLMIGGVYAVISIGLTLVFGVMGIINFAQAEFLMLGMFVAYFAWAWLGLDPLVAAPAAFVIVGALGIAVQALMLRRVMRAPPVAQVFLTVGLLIVLQNAALLAFGSSFRSVATPYQASALRLGPLYVSVPYLSAFAASIASGLGLWIFLQRSWFGRAMRATAQDPFAAELMGINTQEMHRLAFGLGVGLTAFGGAVILPYLTVYPTVGDQFVVLMFTVVVLGGLGSVLGAIAGGFSVGFIQSLSGLFLPVQLQNLVLFVVFIAVLALRPEGLLGTRR
ncbi:MAG TPA: branched-chain amino acid ABC transporter permease [Bradyrhizobium sp.]|jgi:branched-chain amino acid transport system permease protein|nr:branched-chain amino acid ABC transporter permease [Bradyrhizobium sp.]